MYIMEYYILQNIVFPNDRAHSSITRENPYVICEEHIMSCGIEE